MSSEYLLKLNELSVSLFFLNKLFSIYFYIHLATQCPLNKNFPQSTSHYTIKKATSRRITV